MRSPFPILPLSLVLLRAATAQETPPLAPIVPPALPTDLSLPDLSLPDLSLPDSPEPEVALEDLIARALQNNPQIAIARESRQAARERVGAIRAFPNPQLQLVPGLTGQRDARDEEVIVSQPLDLFGQRRAGRAVAQAGLRRAEAALTLSERSLVVQVKNAAADLFAAQEAENLGQIQVEVAHLFRGAAARKAEVGDVPPVQVQRAELEVLRASNELSSARAERLVRRAALNNLTEQAPETPLRVALPFASGLEDLLKKPLVNAKGTAFPVAGSGANSATTPPVLPVQTPVVGASSQIDADLVAQRVQLQGASIRPDIIGAQATLEANRAQVVAIGRGRLPQVEIQARRSAFFGHQGSAALRAVVTVPLFDFGSISREKKAAQAEVRAQEAQIRLLQAQAATQIEQALIRLNQQRQTVLTYRTGIVPLTLDLLRKTQIGYTAGASTYLEVLEAQRTLRQVQTEYLQALVGTRTSEAALESALGAGLPSGLTGDITNPSGPAALPGTAAPGTIPESVFPPNILTPLDPVGAPPSQSISNLPALRSAPQGGR